MDVVMRAVVNTQLDDPATDLGRRELWKRPATYIEILKPAVVLQFRNYRSMHLLRTGTALETSCIEIKGSSITFEVDFISIDKIISAQNFEILYVICVWIIRGCDSIDIIKVSSNLTTSQSITCITDFCQARSFYRDDKAVGVQFFVNRI